MTIDDAPDCSLPRDRAEDDRRLALGASHEVAGQPCERDDLDVGDRPEAPDDKVADTGAHGRRAHDDGERRQGVVALELEDARRRARPRAPENGR